MLFWRDEQQYAVILFLLTELPGPEQLVGIGFNLLAFERRDGGDNELDPGLGFEIGQLQLNRIARRYYIEAVRVYNTSLKTFPGILWAATFFRANKPMAEFTANENAQTPPQVKF
jgi:hypothetical protein